MCRITRHAWLLCLFLVACGSREAPEPPPPSKPRPTVFDDLVQKRKEIPAAAEQAQAAHVAATRQAIDEAEGAPAPSDGAPR